MGHFDGKQPARREIRVLDILPGPLTEEIKCNLRIASLDTHTEYEALSYVWGDLPAQEAIQVSNHRILVTPNLHAALKRLRRQGKTRTMWIDQLCINQWDIEEKSSQVSMMRDIYRNCSHCIIWLGEIPYETKGFEEKDAVAVFDFITDVARLEMRSPIESPIQPRHWVDRDLPTLFQDGEEGEAARRAFAAFAMYGNTWWSRIWTIQESILPGTAELVWGSLSLSRADVLLTALHLRGDKLRSFPIPFQNRRVAYTPLLRCLLYPIHGFNHSTRGEKALDLFMRWRHRHATDSRDKVYALLGLLPQDTVPSAQPCSYFLSQADLFSRVTLDIMREEQSLRALVAASEMEHETKDLPSWPIDFACSNRVGKRQLKWWGHSHRYLQFTACAENKLELSVSNAGRELQLRGVFIDEVLSVNDVYTATEDEPLIGETILDIISKCEEMVAVYRESHKNQATYPGGASWSSALWRTMIGDLIMREFPVERAKDSHEADFQRAKEHLADEGRSVPNVLVESIQGMVPNHAFFITKAGYIGIGPPWMASGDQIWVFYGGNVPFVMRAEEEDNRSKEAPTLKLVGDAYVHGIMDGEAFRETHQAQSVRIL